MPKRIAKISVQECVACGCCTKACPKQAIAVWKGIHARVDEQLCIGCGKCAAECPASIITLEVVEK